MPDNLVIVESPAKGRTIKKYLGKDFEVLASYGHVRDLVPKEGAVDPDAGFAMRYQLIERNERHVEAISRALRKASSLYLATDPDREGEAIAWHLYEILKERGALEGKEVHRVVFHEITRNAIREAVAAPRELSLDLVNAQQARRALDYLVGFNLSPLLWKKVRRGLSAGRVQSPALRMICEREEEIAAFVPQEYWSIDAQGEHSRQTFPLKLVEFQGRKVEQFSFTDAAAAHAAEQALRSAAGEAGTLRVLAVDRKQRRRNPSPAVHDLDAAAGGLAQARLLRLAHDAAGAAAVRGHRHRRGQRRPDHLHAHRLGVAGRRGRDRDPRGDRPRSTARTRVAERDPRLPHQVEECPGSARGDPPDLGGRHSRRHRALPGSRPVQALCPDLEARAWPARWRLRCSIPWPWTCWRGAGRRRAARAARQRLDARQARLHRGVPGRQRRRGRRRQRSRAAGDGGGRHRAACARSCRSSISPSRRRASRRPRWSRRSRSTASAAPRPTRRSSRRCAIASYAEIESRRFTATDIGKIVNRFLTEHFHRYVEYGFTAAMEDELDAVVARRGALDHAADEVLEAIHRARSRTSRRTSRANRSRRRANSASIRSAASR